jgi:5-hydroxyisourate hydrolase
MSQITTHVLNTVSGRPAAGVPVILEIRVGDEWKRLGETVTDADGRVRDLLPEGHALAPGLYSLRYEVAAISSFFPEITIRFRVENPEQHYHVPLLLSAYGYTTYRGS